MAFYRIILATYILFPAFAWASQATQTPPVAVGFDFSIPYIVTVDGNGFNDVDQKEIGLSLHYFTSNNISFGTRFGVDVQEFAGRTRQWTVAPGIRYQWFQGRTWMPFIQTDIPIIVRGAFNSTGSSSRMDMGFIGGFGLAWNIGNQMGLENLLLRYSFSTQYFFGFGGAVRNFGFEFANFGIEYRF